MQHSKIFMFMIIAPLIMCFSSCGDQQKANVKDKSTSNVAISTKPTPKLNCNDPFLINQLQWVISEEVYKPQHLLVDRSKLFTVELLSERELSREMVDVGNYKKVVRIKCEADLNLTLVDEQLFDKADKMHVNVKSKGAEGLSISNNYGRSFTMAYIPTQEEYMRGASKSSKPMQSAVKGNITYIAALEDNDKEKAKGNYFAFNSDLNVRYLFSSRFGDPSFRDALRDSDVVMSWLDLEYKPTGSNTKNWREGTKTNFTNICKRFQYQLSQCDCMQSDFQKNFTDEEFAKAEQSALFIDGARSGEFPFKPTKSFPSVYPVVWDYLGSVIQKCGK